MKKTKHSKKSPKKPVKEKLRIVEGNQPAVGEHKPANIPIAPSKKLANNTQNMTPGEREAYWRQIVEAFKKSGLSQARFSKERGVSMTALSEWKNRFLIAEKGTSALRIGASSARLSEDDLKGQLELKHPSGFSIVMNANTPEGLLNKALESLAKLTQG
jgi:lambda repressor-like predicted transcriptional regulator